MNLKNKRLLLIGGAGLIGSHTVDELLKEDVTEIRIFDNMTRGTEENLKDALKDPRVNIFPLGGDLMHRDILDAAMNDFMRPALYGAKHRIIPLIRKRQISKKTYEFVGPICETTDKFLTTNKFQNLKEKDIIIICDVGAYGSSLSSNYNLRVKPSEILIKGSNIVVIKKRQKLKDLI